MENNFNQRDEFNTFSGAIDTSNILTKSSAPERVTDFTKTKVGLKTLEDAVLNIETDVQKANPRLSSKNTVLQAIDKNDLDELREISEFWYRTNGIYQRLCKYMANLYCYDWMLTPYIADDKIKEEKVLKIFYDGLTLLDNFNVKAFLGKAALKTIRKGAYYGYVVEKDKTHKMVQELPIQYCRSRFECNGRPAIEFNMKYFDTAFKDTEQRLRMLDLFPKEFKKGYVLFKEGKLPPQFRGDTSGWYLLDPKYAFAFFNNGDQIPLFISVIPYLIDLDQAQALDRKKMAQNLVKIIIQKMPLDKNGDMIFDMDEMAVLHQNAVQMLGKAIGVDVLTTLADVDVADLADSKTTASIDELEKVERTAFNASGVAQNLFNTEGNIALDRSILNDEASLYNLILQFESFLNLLVESLNVNKKVNLRVQLLKTTIYNYKDLSKQYKELTGMGYSKILPLVALGQSQSSILANAYFETQVLDLVSLLIPPLTSNTMNSDSLKAATGKDSTPGRKEKEENEKSDKTLANQESMN